MTSVEKCMKAHITDDAKVLLDRIAFVDKGLAAGLESWIKSVRFEVGHDLVKFVRILDITSLGCYVSTTAGTLTSLHELS